MSLPSGSTWLPAVHDVVNTLAALVGTSFGPAGRDKVMKTPVGQMIITNSGDQIAQHLQANQPIATFVLDALGSHTRAAGDGSSAVLLMLSGAFRAALHYVGDSSPTSVALHDQSRMRLHRLLRSLEAIHRHWLVDGALERWLVSAKASALPSTGNTAKLAITHVIRTALGQKLSIGAVAVLSTKIVDLLLQSRASDEQPIHDVASALLADYPFQLCPGVAVTETQSLHGFLFPGRLAVRGMPSAFQSSRALILHCDLHPAPKGHEASRAHLKVHAASSQQSVEFLTSGEAFARRWVERLKRERIDIVLSSYKIHDASLALLAAAGIATVEGMDEFDTRRLSRYTSASAVTSLDAFEDRELPLAHFAAFTQILVGGQSMLHIELSHPSTSSAAGSSHASIRHAQVIKGHTLLLCGASDGMCKQYQSLLQRCLRLVADWSSSSAVFAATHSSSLSATRAPPTAASSSPPVKPPSSSFGSLKGGFLNSSSAKPTAAAVPAASPPLSAPSASPLYVVGGGGSVELSLLLFCEAQARGESSAASTPLHPLLPTSDGLHDAAFGVIAAGLSHLLQTMLQNSHPTGSAAAANVERNSAVPWIKIAPHLRAIHDLSGLRNLGFSLVNVQTPPPYTPLHHLLRPSPTRFAADLLPLQLLIGTSEVALLSLLPPLFTLGDTLSTSAPPLFEPLSTKVHIVSSCLTILRTLLKLEGMLLVKKISRATNDGNSLAALNFGPGVRDRRRIRSHDPWHDDDECDSDSGTSSADSDVDSDSS